MKSVVETLSPTRVKLTVEVPFDEIKPSLDKAYKTVAQNVTIAGFRKGKVPPAVIDRQVGRGYVLDQAINEILPAKYTEALQENDLEPLAQPEIDVTKFEDNDTLEFTAEVDVKPQFDLPAYEGLTAEVADLEVTDEDVATQLDAMRERFGTLKDVERAAAEGDFVVLDLKATKGGEDVEGAEAAGLSYKVGTNGLVPGIDEAVIGLSAGESKDFTSQLVGGDLVGEDVDIKVTVTQVQEQELPALDDEFAQMASEFDTLDEFKGDVKERLGRGKRLEQAAEARDAVLQVLIDTIEIPLPESIVADELNGRRQMLEQQLAYAGMTLTNYLEDEKQTIEEFEADLDRRTRDSITAQFILDAVAQKEQFEPTQAELSQAIIRRAQQAGQDPQEYANHLTEHPHHVPEMIAEVIRGKALAKIVESATVTDKSGNKVELANLLPDGTIATPAEDDAAEA